MLNPIEIFYQVISYLARYPKIGRLLGTIFGLLEVPILDAIYFIDKRIIPKSYQQLMKIFSLFYGSKIIPLGVKINGSLSVAPTEEVLELIKRMPAVSVGYCYCRAKNKNCDNPIWSCIHIGTAKNLKELGKRIPLKKSSFDEVEKLLLKANKLGLVHQLLTAPTSDYVYVICNCCTCCCVMLQNAIKYNFHGVAMPSNFIVEYSETNCKNCGNCIVRCHFKALTLNNSILTFDPKKCVGCGLCIDYCLENALKLIRRKDSKNL